MKRRVLFVPMHLSTGGSPKWLLELIRDTMLQNEVFVTEFNDYGSYDVHRNQVKDLVGKKSYTCLGACFSDDWENERMHLLKIIEDFREENLQLLRDQKQLRRQLRDDLRDDLSGDRRPTE